MCAFLGRRDWMKVPPKQRKWIHALKWLPSPVPVRGPLPFPPTSLGEVPLAVITTSLRMIPSQTYLFTSDLYPVIQFLDMQFLITVFRIQSAGMPLPSPSGTILGHTSSGLSILPGFPDTKAGATTHLTSQFQSRLLGLAMLLIWSHPGDCCWPALFI